MKQLSLLLCFTLLIACVDTVSETRGTFTVRGTTYETVTRQFQRSDGSTYSRMTIYAGAERVTCRPNDRADCDAALWQTRYRTNGSN
ncbi:MAG: hypothetical protein AB3N22_21520 [Ruegeria sp.]